MNNKFHPYKALPNKSFWNRSVTKPPVGEVDPVGKFDLQLTPETKVATAGSCFAQHIARHLQKSGFRYYVTEEGHPILPQNIREKHHYGTFSARYGNIYTARQLLQLFHRAYGEFSPIEDVWIEEEGRVLDPYRPTIQPGGFISVAEMHADRHQHLKAVRRMFETLDVFVFTLGLTECWVSKKDGAAFPLCPGVEGGAFDPDQHRFLNQGVSDVVQDMSAFIGALKNVNPRAQIVVTVSPVPLMATAEPEAHVLCATTYSKSVLRVAADMLRKSFANVHYFPSYEIITGSFSRGRYFAEDLRNVTEQGVSHVMRLFLQYTTNGGVNLPLSHLEEKNIDDFISQAEAIVQVECDEIALDR
jgi:hypothetical protein